MKPGDGGKWSAVHVKEYVEALLGEAQRATEMAEREREKAAIALHQEQARAQEVAERERSKAAEALAATLATAIAAGDERLREHITQQYAQIAAALKSAEKLESERFAAAKESTHALEEKLNIIQGASRDAILKAEAASEKRFEGVNEFRGQLSDQAALFLPREVADAQFAELRKQIAQNTGRIDTATGKSLGVDATVGLGLAVATVIISVIVLFANGVI